MSLFRKYFFQLFLLQFSTDDADTTDIIRLAVADFRFFRHHIEFQPAAFFRLNDSLSAEHRSKVLSHAQQLQQVFQLCTAEFVNRLDSPAGEHFIRMVMVVPVFVVMIVAAARAVRTVIMVVMMVFMLFVIVVVMLVIFVVVIMMVMLVFLMIMVVFMVMVVIVLLVIVIMTAACAVRTVVVMFVFVIMLLVIVMMVMVMVVVLMMHVRNQLHHLFLEIMSLLQRSLDHIAGKLVPLRRYDRCLFILFTKQLDAFL